MNGDPVLFSALAIEGVPTYGFECASCGLHHAAQPDSLCPRCEKAAKPSRRRAVKPRPARAKGA